MIGRPVTESEPESYDVELGPFFTAGVIVLAYGLLRRKKLADRNRARRDLDRPAHRVRPRPETAHQERHEGEDQGARS